jgi:hypothetical protein
MRQILFVRWEQDEDGACFALHRYIAIQQLGFGSRIQSFGKFDGSGVSGSPGRSRSQALESKVRFADKPDITLAGKPSRVQTEVP